MGMARAMHSSYPWIPSALVFPHSRIIVHLPHPLSAVDTPDMASLVLFPGWDHSHD